MRYFVYFTGLCFLLSSLFFSQSFSQLFSQTSAPPKEAVMHAAGSFDVKVTPLADQSGDPTLGRMALDKQYHGDLEATGKGQMLTAGSPAKGAGGYVAIEKVTGMLNGKSGSFVLQHTGTMSHSGTQLTITVVPESGTDQLEGIAGKLNMKVAPDGKHSYEFEYTLPTNI